MRNSEYSSTHLPPLCLRAHWKGLPARVWRDLTSAIGIRKAGQDGGQGGRKVLLSRAISFGPVPQACTYGRAVAKIVCAACMILECNTQRAILLVTFVAGGEVQFDSDYSEEDGASPFSFAGQFARWTLRSEYY